MDERNQEARKAEDWKSEEALEVQGAQEGTRETQGAQHALRGYSSWTAGRGKGRGPRGPKRPRGSNTAHES